jgi:hypothetical protein
VSILLNLDWCQGLIVLFSMHYSYHSKMISLRFVSTCSVDLDNHLDEDLWTYMTAD